MMKCWIEQPQSPKQLLLVWQAPVNINDRLRWAVGRLHFTVGSSSFVYLKGEEFRALNLGRSEEQLKALGFSGYPAFDRMRQPEAGYWNDALKPFLRRVPSRRRPDFETYLEHHGIKATTTLSPQALLAVTEAHLPSDGFSLIDPLDVSATEVDFIFEVAGFRHLMRSTMDLQLGQTLTLSPEPDNKWDKSAVQVMANDMHIGYINRLQAATINQWFNSRNLQCRIVRLNGKPDAPRAYALASIRSISSIMSGPAKP